MSAVSGSDLPKIQETYGAAGVESVKTMDSVLADLKLKTSYNAEKRLFTILDSSKYSRVVLEMLFKEQKYDCWTPRVLEKPDELGNRLVVLVCEEPREFSQNATDQEREDITRARQLFREAIN